LFIKKQLPKELYSVVSFDITGALLQVMHKDATKSRAVSELARLWGIKQSEVVTFGDDFNDIDMLEYAGIGVAVGNAIDEVKAVSKYICQTNDEDGVAWWINENIL